MEYIVEFILIGLFVFPLPYVFYKRGENKFIYVSSVIGSSVIIEFLVLLVALPVIILLNFVFPQLEAVGLTKNIEFLITFSDIVGKYYFFITPFLHILMSFAIFRRYEFFKTNT
jgi:hypothetical protein